MPKRELTNMYKSELSLHSANGQRKYLNSAERQRFYEATKTIRLDKKLFCQLLYFTGARIAEIHNLTTGNIDFSNRSVVIESLKKRRKGVFREIPLPSSLLEELHMYIKQRELLEDQRVWDFSVRTASRHVKKVMILAGIKGLHATAKGLRHGFAVAAVARIPLTLVKRWLGHSRLETTEIYLGIMGSEEREMAKKLWLLLELESEI
jgi:integrase/recombinase XerD